MHKKALTVAVAGALAVPMAAQAVEVSVSGHVARALVVTDSDNSDNTTQVKDWGSSPSRFRMSGSGEIMDGGTSAGLFLELGEKGNMRQSHVFFEGGFGKIALGDASDAADSRAYSDKSGTFIAHGQESGSIETGDYFDGLSGGTTEGVHYSSPSFGMGKLEASVGNDDRWSVSAVLDTTAGGAAVRGEAGYLDYGSNDTSIGASLGAKLAGGITFSAAWAKRTNEKPAAAAADAPDPSDPGYFQATVGYILGDTSFAVSWYRSSDFVNDGSEGNIVGVGFNHNLPKANAHLFASAQQFKAEDTAASLDAKDTVFVVGSRVRF